MKFYIWFSPSVFQVNIVDMCIKRIHTHRARARSYVSRISNATVLQRAGCQPLDRRLLQEQLLLYGKVARSPAADVLRSYTFIPSTTIPASQRYVRRCGRPRNEWTTMVQRESFRANLSSDLVHDQRMWKHSVVQYCQRPRASGV